MNSFKIRKGPYPPLEGGQNVFHVIDPEARLQGSETIAALVLDTDSGRALVDAMLMAGAIRVRDKAAG